MNDASRWHPQSFEVLFPVKNESRFLMPAFLRGRWAVIMSAKIDPKWTMWLTSKIGSTRLPFLYHQPHGHLSWTWVGCRVSCRSSSLADTDCCLDRLVSIAHDSPSCCHTPPPLPSAGASAWVPLGPRLHPRPPHPRHQNLAYHLLSLLRRLLRFHPRLPPAWEALLAALLTPHHCRCHCCRDPSPRRAPGKEVCQVTNSTQLLTLTRAFLPPWSDSSSVTASVRLRFGSKGSWMDVSSEGELNHWISDASFSEPSGLRASPSSEAWGVILCTKLSRVVVWRVSSRSNVPG